MLAPQIFVFEDTPRWLPELQRQFQGEDVELHACDLQTSSRLNKVPTKLSADHSDLLKPKVIVMDLRETPADCLQFLERQFHRRHPIPGIVISDTRHQGLEWFFREVGAKSFLLESVTGEQLADLCRRYWVNKN